MQYTTEDLSPVKKKLTITVPVEEGDAAIVSAIAIYRTSVTLDGFRKGKVPASIIEQRFRENIYREATSDLINVHINEIMTEGTFKPISRIDFDGGELERGKEFVYSISFEIMPEFDLPAYDGIEVEQEEALVAEDEITTVIDRLRNSVAEVVTLEKSRTAQKGDIAVVDFDSFDESGKAVEGVSAKAFQLPLGEGQTLEDFEKLIYTLKPGENTEGPVVFPSDFFNAEFAGKTITMKVKLLELKERKLPALDAEFAKKTGNFDSIEKLQDNIRDSYMNSKTGLHKGEAQKKLLDSLIAKVDFTLPEAMVANHIAMLVGELQEKLERQGKDFASIGKTEEALREEMRPEAEARAKAHIFLLTVASQNKLEVTEQEVDLQIRRMAIQSRQDYNTVKEYYTKNNLLFALRDRLLADKGMEELYSKAKVQMVPPQGATSKKATAKPKKEATSDTDKKEKAEKPQEATKTAE